jgi:DNA transposition AAA+ family ATPase
MVAFSCSQAAYLCDVKGKSVANEQAIGSTYTAPIPQLNPERGPEDILNIASGSGLWVIEVFKI